MIFFATPLAEATAPATVRNRCLNIYSSFLDRIMALPLHEQFQKQTLANAIESATDMAELKGVASLLLDLYFRQKSATMDIVEGKI